MELISQAEYARRLGIAPSTLHRYIRKGVIVLVDGKVDVEQADQALAMTSSPLRKKLRFEETTWQSPDDLSWEWPDKWPR